MQQTKTSERRKTQKIKQGANEEMTLNVFSHRNQQKVIWDYYALRVRAFEMYECSGGDGGVGSDGGGIPRLNNE